MSNLEKQIQTDLMSAMKEKNWYKLGALRSVKTAIQNEKTNGSFHELTDAEIIKIIQKQIKQRTESETIYRSAGRNELADKEFGEKEVLEQYVPQVLSHDKLVEAINTIINDLNAQTIKDMGKVMGELNKRFFGQVDGKMASTIIKEKLTS